MRTVSPPEAEYGKAHYDFPFDVVRHIDGCGFAHYRMPDEYGCAFRRANAFPGQCEGVVQSIAVGCQPEHLPMAQGIGSRPSSL